MGNAIMLGWDLWHTVGHFVPTPGLLAILIRFGLSEPFLEFQDSPFNAALGLFILFIGLRAAWRMTSGEPGAAEHPFRR